jgi:hypothetical protein
MKYTIDKHMVDETISCAENSYFCYQHLINDYLSNLQKKVAKGIYDHKLAIKLLEYYYSNYVRPTMKKEWGTDPKLNPAERAEFAEYFVDYLEDEYLNQMKKDLPKKGKAKTKKRK